MGATAAVHLSRILHAYSPPSRHPFTPQPPLGELADPNAIIDIMRGNCSCAVRAQKGGKSAIHVMLMRAVIEGDKVPLGDTGPLSCVDQHAAAGR